MYYSAPALDGTTVLLELLFLAVVLIAQVAWILTIVEVASLPTEQFAAAGSSKTTWLVIVVLFGLLGVLIWRLTRRNRVRAATYTRHVPWPSWYPPPAAQTGQWELHGEQWFWVPFPPPAPPPPETSPPASA